MSDKVYNFRVSYWPAGCATKKSTIICACSLRRAVDRVFILSYFGDWELHDNNQAPGGPPLAWSRGDNEVLYSDSAKDYD